MGSHRIAIGTRTRAFLPAVAALLLGVPVFFAGMWVIQQMSPGVARGVATFLLLAVTVGFIGLTRSWAGRALARARHDTA